MLWCDYVRIRIQESDLRLKEAGTSCNLLSTKNGKLKTLPSNVFWYPSASFRTNIKDCPFQGKGHKRWVSRQELFKFMIGVGLC